MKFADFTGDRNFTGEVHRDNSVLMSLSFLNFQAAASSAAPAAVVPDPAIVEQLLGMGFDVNGCKKAAFHTNNSGFEAAVNWIMSHMEDPDFAAPYVQPG